VQAVACLERLRHHVGFEGQHCLIERREFMKFDDARAAAEQESTKAIGCHS
jgi:hypothetical protein